MTTPDEDLPQLQLEADTLVLVDGMRLRLRPVDDDLQGLGIGTELARRTVDRARVNGFTLLTATTLWENRPARALLRRLTFRACASDDGAIDQQLVLHTDTCERTASPAPATT